MYEAAKARVRGLVLNLTTPFKPDTFELDEDGLRRNIECYVEAGVSVLMITAGSSDFAVLSDEEIVRMHRAVVEAAAGRAFVIGCTATWWLGRVVESARFCHTIGCDAMMVIKHEPPQATADDFLDFHRAVADACPIPLFYHSYMTGPKSAEVVKRVCDIPAVIGMKQKTTVYTQYSLLRETLGDRLAVVAGGGGELAFHAMQFGAVGALTGIGQWSPARETAWLDQLCAGDFEAAKPYLERSMRFRRAAQATNSYMRAIKHAMDLAGLAGGPLRPMQALELTDDQKAMLAAVIEETGLLG